MTTFTDKELEYLRGQRLARLATADPAPLAESERLDVYCLRALRSRLGIERHPRSLG
jgi:hypothetical protein